MGFPQYALIGIYMFSLGVNLAVHGKEKEGKYNFWHSLLTFVIVMTLLVMGGYFE